MKRLFPQIKNNTDRTLDVVFSRFRGFSLPITLSRSQKKLCSFTACNKHNALYILLVNTILENIIILGQIHSMIQKQNNVYLAPISFIYSGLPIRSPFFLMSLFLYSFLAFLYVILFIIITFKSSFITAPPPNDFKLIPTSKRSCINV